jgi:hypothetical protein
MLTLAGHRRHTPTAGGYDDDEQFVANNIDELSTLSCRVYSVTRFFLFLFSCLRVPIVYGE